MVLTIEPGIYIPRDASTVDVPDAFRGIGIRVEDSCVDLRAGLPGADRRSDQRSKRHRKMDGDQRLSERAGTERDRGVNPKTVNTSSILVAGAGPVGAAAH